MTATSPVWLEINLVARSYLDMQQTRIGFELRQQKAEEHQYVVSGLCVYEKKKIIDKNGNEKNSTKCILTEESEKLSKAELTAEKKRIVKTELVNHRAYNVLIDHKKMIYKQERQLLDDAMELYDGTAIDNYCRNVRGLGPVATMTFSGYINPNFSCGQLYSYLGLTPDRSRLKKGVQGKTNPHVKGRFWYMCMNTIRAKDQYYYPIYKIKKEYLKKRPDLVWLKSEKPKGWDGRIDNMAKRVLMKLIISHAYDTLTGTDSTFRHRNPVPIKPYERSMHSDIHSNYRTSHDRILERLEELAKLENKDKYFEYLYHAEDY